MRYVYLLKSESVAGQRYVGLTSDLKKRLAEHNARKSPHTSKHAPWRLVFPIKAYQRWRNRLGKRAVPCMVSDRWLQFPEKSDGAKGGHFMFVDVMTRADGENARKIC